MFELNFQFNVPNADGLQESSPFRAPVYSQQIEQLVSTYPVYSGYSHQHIRTAFSCSYSAIGRSLARMMTIIHHLKYPDFG
ncbi:hypothetical protein GJ496_001105 [Pomphorhynchus laevis]|nr:hypothetical protein GJ496_001105 [Pomphorhynchus laevis]